MTNNAADDNYSYVERREDLQSLYSEALNESPIYNILPLYQMHSSVVNKNVDAEIHYSELPGYLNLNSVTSESSNSSYANVSNSSLVPSSSSNPSNYSDPSMAYYENSILNNVQKLSNVSFSTKNEFSQSLRLNIVLTEGFGKMNSNSTQTKQEEYSQNDSICGYVLLENKSRLPIQFEIFYVLLEGYYESSDKERIVRRKENFLEMVDLCSSYQNASDAKYDIQDGDENCIFQNNLLPNKVCKRFFCFNIPEHLLESSCSHQCPYHTELPPTIGNANVGAHIKYRIKVILIGKESMYSHLKLMANFPKHISDDYIVLKEAEKYLRVVPVDSFSDLQSRSNFSALTYKSLHESIDFYLNSFSELGMNLETLLSTSDSKSTYIDEEYPISHQQFNMGSYSLVNSSHNESTNIVDEMSLVTGAETDLIQIKQCRELKKTIGIQKITEYCFLKSPKVMYKINYIKPPQYRINEYVDERLWKFDIPVTLSSNVSSSLSIKKVRAELFSVTIVSKNSSIPISIDHQMVFQNENNLKFEDIIAKPMQKKLERLRDFSKKLGSNSVRMESALYNDINSVSNLYSIYVVMDVKGVNLTPVDTPKALENEEKHESSYNISIDLTKSRMKYRKQSGMAYNLFCLVPSFQSCYLARLYFLKLEIELKNGFTFTLKVPIDVSKYNEI